MTEKRALRVGLVGSGIGQSLTPGMHMAEGAAAGLDYDYVFLDVDTLPPDRRDLATILSDAERAGFRGLNVTHPFKQAVLPLLDEIDDNVAVLGSCNTVVFENGLRVGHNTDWWGFSESFKQQFPGAALDHVVQLGAGGAGSAVAYALLVLGVGRLEIFDIDQDRVRDLVERYQARFGAHRVAVGIDLESATLCMNGLVQTSPIGSLGHPGLPMDPALLPSSAWLVDIIYFPMKTALVLAAEERGLRAAGGGGMAVFQAVRAFSVFAGIPADADRMSANFARLASARR